METGNNVTTLLRAWGEGDSQAGEQLFSSIYDELRRLARFHAARVSGASLEPTALVHVAFVRMAGGDLKTDWRDRSQFFAFAAVVMRRVMLDYARYQNAERRDRSFEVSFDEAIQNLGSHGIDIQHLDDALIRLEQIDPRQSRIVELRFFGGMTVEETATYLDLSPRTVNREWGMAKAWLASALREAE